ncbi:MAG: hypothetical protein C0625_08820 [Arcobacter sp.]|nr:MAG: hypothetical protein C0625_08820 [Arcobacter sp.]
MKNNFKEIIAYSQKLNVLFIEDNESVRIQLLKLLENFFCNIEIENNGLSGYENYINYFKKNKINYDLVITDLSMPKLNGMELSKKIIEHNSTQLIIVISAQTESEKLLTLLDIGIHKILQKPVDYRELLDCLISTINKIKK